MTSIEKLNLKNKPVEQLALALVDDRGVVRECTGDWQHHGYPAVHVGEHIDEKVTPLIGMFPASDIPPYLCLPFIEEAHGRYGELAIIKCLGGILVALKEVTATAVTSRSILHARNQLELANAGLARLASELGQALTALRRYHTIYEHEVRNAAQNIQAAVEMLQTTSPQLQANAYMHTVASSTVALLAALNAALEVERAVTHRSPADLIPATFVDDIYREFQPLAQMHGLGLVKETAAGTDRVVALDPFRMRLILGNLLGNAIKFTRTGTIRLSVGLQPTGDLIFSVTDSGPGLSPSVRKALATAFAADAYAREDISGLGLYICNHLTVSMGGRLAVQSCGAAGTCISAIFAARAPSKRQG